MTKGRKTGGRQKGTPKTGGRRKGTPNRLTVAMRALAPLFARDAKDIQLLQAIGTPEFERLLRELEQEPWPELEWGA